MGATIGLEPGVWGPQAGERLANGAQVVLHSARADGLVAGGEFAGS